MKPFYRISQNFLQGQLKGARPFQKDLRNLCLSGFVREGSYISFMLA